MMIIVPPITVESFVARLYLLRCVRISLVFSSHVALLMCQMHAI